MPIYEYMATDQKGQTVSDTVNAQNRKAALDELFNRGLCPASLQEKKAANAQARRFSGRISKSDVEQFTRELGNLLAAGMSLSKALKILSRESTKPVSQKLWTDIHDSVANGMSLAESMQQYPKIFSSVYIAMVQAGETGGFIELVLGQIADFRSRNRN
jgi:type II secretory pathway component PulF